MKPINYRRWLWATISLVVALACITIGFSFQADIHHFKINQNNDTESVREMWVWVSSFSVATRGEITGTMQSINGFWLENSAQLSAQLWVNDIMVYEGTDTTWIDLLSSTGQSIRFTLRYENIDKMPFNGFLGFSLEGVAGLHYPMPAWNFAPDNPLQTFARIVVFISLFLCFGFFVASLNLSFQDRFIIVLLWGTVILCHFIIFNEKLESNTALWTMDKIWDNYVVLGRQWIVGQLSLVGLEMQQGNFIFLAFTQLFFGSNIIPLYWFNILLASLFVPCIYLVTKAYFNRTSALIAGIASVLFVPLLHYQQTLQPESPLLLLLILLLGTYYLIAYYNHPLVLIVCGILVGISTVMRGAMFFLLIPPMFIILRDSIHWRQKISQICLILMTFYAPILPITLTNMQGGYTALLPGKGDIQLVRANSLDAVGLNSYKNLSETLGELRGESLFTTFIRDVNREPLRIIELTLRRIGLIWDNRELSDAGMIDYAENTLQHSSLARILSLNGSIGFRTLLFFATIGMVACVMSDKRIRYHFFIVLLGAVSFSLVLILFYTIGRIRIQLTPFLLPIASYGIVFLVKSIPKPKQFFKLVGVSAILLVMSFTVADWLSNNLPRPRLITENELPNDLVVLSPTFNDEIVLLGYRDYETNYQADGYLTFELFWKALQPPSEDYVVTFRLVNTTTQTIDVIINERIGASRPPNYLTTNWDTNQIFYERYLLRLPNIYQTYTVYMGVYSEKMQKSVLVNYATNNTQDNHIRLMAVQTQESLPILDTAPPLAIWQDSLAFIDFVCTIQNNVVQLETTWRVDKRLTQNPHFFVHLLNGEELVGQYDGTLHTTTPLDALPMASLIHSNNKIVGSVPPTSIKFGFYTVSNGERLTIQKYSALSTDENNTLTVPCAISNVP